MPQRDRVTPLTILAIVVTLTFWSSSFAGIRACLRPDAFSPGHLALLRVGLAALLLGLAGVFLRFRLPERRDVPTALLMGLLGMTVYHTTLSYGARTISAGSASFLISTAPVFTAVTAFFWLGERLRPAGWAGIAISMAGTALIALGEGRGIALEPGVFLVLTSAISASLYIVLQKRLLARYTALEVTFYAASFGALGLLVFAPGFPHAVVTVPRSALAAAVYLGVFPTAIAYFTWTYVLSHLSASRTSSILYAMPALALVVAWIWLGEVPHWPALVGGVIALCGVAVVNWRPRTAS